MKNEENRNKNSQLKNTRHIALLSGQAACLTLIVAGLALVVGLWLDARLGTAPRWTLILLIGSAPLTFGGVLWLIRQGLKRIHGEGVQNEPSNETINNKGQNV